jgi:CheY-like chemotaxis protein
MSPPLRVLLVEDNPGDADLTRDTLESGQLRLEIEIVVDGEQAIDYLMQRGRHAAAAVPDLIVLDLNLPRRGGAQVLAEIKRHEQLRTIPIVILTSSDAPKDIAQSYKLGANCYVTKPVDLTAFISTVQSIESFWLSVVKLP